MVSSVKKMNITEKVRVYWYDCDREYQTKFCEENHRQSRLVLRSVLVADQ